VGDVLFKMALYYFVFEMYYVALKLECTNAQDYKRKKIRVKCAKWSILLGLLLIQMPLATASLTISTVKEF
jgi:uncharacterized membrane protein